MFGAVNKISAFWQQGSQSFPGSAKIWVLNFVQLTSNGLVPLPVGVRISHVLSTKETGDKHWKPLGW